LSINEAVKKSCKNSTYSITICLDCC